MQAGVEYLERPFLESMPRNVLNIFIYNILKSTENLDIIVDKREKAYIATLGFKLLRTYTMKSLAW